METETQKTNILLVDDNPHNLLSLETILDAPDRNLVRASSGDEALRYLLDHDAAVILLDVHMPIVDGLETAALIRGRERTRNLPIIFLTAYDSAGAKHLAKGYSLGAVDYIIKPIDPEVLKTKVAVFVELYRKTEQVKQQAELLRQKNIELENANLQRLSRLIDLGQLLAAERDPQQLLAIFCHEARDIVGAQYAAVAMIDKEKRVIHNFFTSGFDRQSAMRQGLPQIGSDFLDRQVEGKRLLLLSSSKHSAKSFHFLPNHLKVTSCLASPLLQQGEIQGWLYLANKLNAEEFNEADERLTVTLTSQAVVAWQNARLYTETQRHATVLEQEITERKHAEKERAELLVREQAARQEAEAANRLKDEFLATVSHELRSPLNVMLGWLTLVRHGKLTADERERAVETIERSARAQKGLIEDLLDVSRIITGKLRLEVRQIELVPLVEAAVESVSPAAEAKGICLRTALDSISAPFQGDSNRLQQVIWNLVSNAIKFTPVGGSVEVRLKQLQDHIAIEVSDTGVGISADFLPHVFDRFRQADGSSTKKHGGLGLGLAIVRHLVEMHGGSVKAESLGEGQGATFTIMLPLTVTSVDFTEREWSLTTSQGVIQSDSAQKLLGLRVLVVDDEPETLELLKTILVQGEAEVQTASSVSEAMMISREWQPEIVISDIGMPEEDGYSLVRQMRKLENLEQRRIPAIALTAHAGADARIRALASGFQMHLPKPVEPDELLVCVASLTGRLARAQSTNE